MVKHPSSCMAQLMQQCVLQFVYAIYHLTAQLNPGKIPERCKQSTRKHQLCSEEDTWATYTLAEGGMGADTVSAKLNMP